METLHCEGIAKSFWGVEALEGLDLVLPPSGITAIIGPNGAGKTTLLNILTGFLRPDVGRCFLGRREITNLPPYRIAQLGIARTFQDLRLILQLSALENVMLARPNQRGERLLHAILRFGVPAEEGNNHEEALKLLRSVGLEEKSNVLADQLSFGQQKLLALACCLATDCRILLLDEPVSGVHPETVGNIIALMQRLRSEGKQLVFIEHDIQAVREVADTVIVMDHGRLIAQGPPGEILDRPDIMEAYIG